MPSVCLLKRQRPVVEKQAAQVAALELFHHDVRRARLEPRHVEHAHDVRAAQSRGRARFEQHAGDDLFVTRVLVANHLDRNGGVQLEVLRAEHDPHAARAELAFDAVLVSQHVAGLYAGSGKTGDRVGAVFSHGGRHRARESGPILVRAAGPFGSQLRIVRPISSGVEGLGRDLGAPQPAPSDGGQQPPESRQEAGERRSKNQGGVEQRALSVEECSG
jgi:hypothetical protein